MTEKMKELLDFHKDVTGEIGAWNSLWHSGKPVDKRRRNYIDHWGSNIAPDSFTLEAIPRSFVQKDWKPYRPWGNRLAFWQTEVAKITRKPRRTGDGFGHQSLLLEHRYDDVLVLCHVDPEGWIEYHLVAMFNPTNPFHLYAVVEFHPDGNQDEESKYNEFLNFLEGRYALLGPTYLAGGGSGNGAGPSGTAGDGGN